MIEFREASKTYRLHGGEVRALDKVSLKFARGSFTVVVGPSGCGKSTLLTLAGGLGRPSSGQILLDGVDLYALPGGERARLRAAKIGFVFQNFHLIPYLGAYENILVPCLVPGLKRAGAPAPDNGKPAGASPVPAPEDPTARAEYLLARFGLKERRNHCPEELSTGERQRVALARALMNGPALLLADEPTGNLDPDNSRAVLAYIEEFRREGGTVVLVTHDLSLGGNDRRLVRLEAGHVVSE